MNTVVAAVEALYIVVMDDQDHSYLFDGGQPLEECYKAIEDSLSLFDEGPASFWINDDGFGGGYEYTCYDLETETELEKTLFFDIVLVVEEED